MAPRAWNLGQGTSCGMEENHGRGPRSWISDLLSG